MYLTRHQFEQNLNTQFWLRDGQDDRAALDLIEVRNGHAPPRYEVFSLFFRGGLERIHPQRMYAVDHDAMGTFDLFLVPVAREENGIMYEAVFNRPIDDQM